MADVTGEGRFTADYTVVSTSGFPGVASPRYQVAMSSIFRRTGFAADQADRYHALVYTFVSSTSQEIDLFALVGGPRIRLFMIKFLEPVNAAAYIDLGGAVTNPWATIGSLRIVPGTILNPGGLILPAAGNGYPLSSTNKQFKMTPSAHAFSVAMLALGASA